MLSFLLLALFLVVIGFAFKLELVVALAWLIGAAILLAFLWKRLAGRSLTINRLVPPQAFLGDQVKIELQVLNNSRLPLPWLTLSETLPSELVPVERPQWLLSLRGREQANVHYTVNCKMRGRYL